MNLALSWHINGGTNTMYFRDDNTLASNRQRTISHTCMTRDFCLLQHSQTTSYRPPVTLICRLMLSRSLMQRKTCWW